MKDNAMISTNESNPARPAGVPPAPRLRRHWWVSLLLSLVIFGSGFVAGGATALVVARNRILYAVHHPEEAPARITSHLRRTLDLSDDQAAKVETILQKRQAAFQALRAEVQPRVMAELDQVETEVAGVLDDAQREKWHRRFGELRETWIPPEP